MAKVVREAVEAGAVGFSTTRTLLHRAKDGELAAGTTASADELIGIGLALGDAGAGVFELASDMFDPEGEFAWMRAIARETGRPVTFNCLQDDLRPEHWRRLVELADEATAGGARIVPQVAGRPASVLFGWDSTAHPFVFHETWRTIADLARADRHARLRDPEVRQAMVTERVEVSGLAAFITSAWHKLFPLGDPPEYEPGPERSVQAIAAREGRTPQEVTYALMMADDGRGLLYIPLLGYATATSTPCARCSCTRARCWGWATVAPTAACCVTRRSPRTCSRTGSATAREAPAWGWSRPCTCRPAARPASMASTTAACWRPATSPTSTSSISTPWPSTPPPWSTTCPPAGAAWSSGPGATAPRSSAVSSCARTTSPRASAPASCCVGHSPPPRRNQPGRTQSRHGGGARRPRQAGRRPSRWRHRPQPRRHP